MGARVGIISTELSRTVARGVAGQAARQEWPEVAGVLIRRRPSRYDCARLRGRQNSDPD